MPNRVPLLLTAAALALSASAALAANAPAVSPLNVQGSAPPKVIERQSRSFVLSFPAPIAKIAQIGRWHEPICVQVVGLAPEQEARVKARIEDVAKAVGLKVKKPGCLSNIQIILTGAPQAVVDKIAQHNEHDLGFHWKSDLNKVKAVTHPIQAWYKTATQGNGNSAGLAFANLTTGAIPNPLAGTGPGGGDPGAGGEAIGNPGSLFGESNHMETVDIPENGSPSGCADSHFSGCLKSLFKNVIVVVDSRAVEGKDLGLIADYLAMMALSRQSLDGCNALPSIVDLFATPACQGRDPPDGLTPADAAYLTALYTSDGEGNLFSEQVDITNRMATILIRAGAAVRESPDVKGH